MLHLTQLSGNPIIRVYCTLAMANVMMDVFCKTPPPTEVVWDKEVSWRVAKKPTLRVKGRDEDEVRHLWSALMHLGLTSGRPFDETTLLVPDSVSFKPKNEFGFMNRWKSDSLYKQLYAKMTHVTYQPQESEFPFGYHVPMTPEMAAIRIEVITILCKSLLDTYFDVNQHTMAFKQHASPDLFYKFGTTKIAQAFATISRQVNFFDFSNKKLNTLEIKQLVKIINSLPITIKKLDLNHNNMHQFGVDGLCYFIKNLPSHITSFSLRNNGLSNFKKAELLRIFDNLSPNIVVVDLAENGLDAITIKQITDIIKTKKENSARVVMSAPRIVEPVGETSIAGGQRFFGAGTNAMMPEPSAPDYIDAEDELPPPYSLI